MASPFEETSTSKHTKERTSPLSVAPSRSPVWDEPRRTWALTHA
jgi:hypothetical protein